MPDPQDRGGATGYAEKLFALVRMTDLDVYALPAQDWTALEGEFASLRAQLAERVARLAEVTQERDRLGVLDMVLKERRHHPDCEVFKQGECGCWLAAVLPVRYRALDQAHRPHHAVDAHTEGTQGTEGHADG